MNSLQKASGEARTSCVRCHKRKKRCDRSLSQCGNCRRAAVTCSFLDDKGQTASYPVDYVHTLECRIQELEASLALRHQALDPIGNDNDSVTTNHDPRLDATCGGGNSMYIQDTLGEVPYFIQSDGLDVAIVRAKEALNTDAESPQRTNWRLDDALKSMLSDADADARGYFGPSSGLCFAELAQSVLGALAIDENDYNSQDKAERDSLDATFDSPSDLLNPHIFSSLGASSPYDPSLGQDSSLGEAHQPASVASNLDSPLNVAHMNRLIEFYFAHSHIIYPVIDRREFMASLRMLQEAPHVSASQSPLCLFRIWMVLAIGSTAYCSVDLSAESESTRYYDKAQSYSSFASTLGSMAAIEVIILRVAYSLFNQLEPNTWLLVGTAARVALGMGLQSSATYEGLALDTVERRKRLFFSLYMMDRVISTTLGRPFAIPDDEIDITPFAALDDDDDQAGGIHGQKSLDLSSMAIPLHILKLRRISSRIQKFLYTHREDPHMDYEERERVVQSIHKELIQWRRDMPFPLPKVDAPVPHFTSTWYDFNYHTHVAMLYRPNNLLPTLDKHRIKVLADAASSSIRLASSMYRQGTFSHHWLNLHAAFTCAISLVYLIAIQLGDSTKVPARAKAAGDVQLAIQLLESLATRFLSARRCKIILNCIMEKRVRHQLGNRV